MRLAALALCALAPSIAVAQCGPREVVIERLGQRYSEERFAMGLANDEQSVFEFYRSDAGTWTIVRSNASGLSCIVAAGKELWLMDPPEGEPTALKKRVLPAGERPVGAHGRKKILVRGARDDGLLLYLGGPQ